MSYLDSSNADNLAIIAASLTKLTNLFEFYLKKAYGYKKDE